MWVTGGRHAHSALTGHLNDATTGIEDLCYLNGDAAADDGCIVDDDDDHHDDDDSITCRSPSRKAIRTLLTAIATIAHEAWRGHCATG